VIGNVKGAKSIILRKIQIAVLVVLLNLAQLPHRPRLPVNQAIGIAKLAMHIILPPESSVSSVALESNESINYEVVYLEKDS